MSSQSWEKDLVRCAMIVLRRDSGFVSKTKLAQKLHEPDSTSTSYTRHERNGVGLQSNALKNAKDLSADAVFMLTKWRAALDPAVCPKTLRLSFARTLRQLGASKREIAHKLRRDTPYLAGGDYHVHRPLRRLLVELVMLRRHKVSGLVHSHIDYAFQTGTVLVDVCAAYPAMRPFIPGLWHQVLTFAPTEKEFQRFGDWSLEESPRPPSTSSEGWRRRYAAMVDFVPAMLEGRAIEWFPMLVQPVLALALDGGNSSPKTTESRLFKGPDPSSPAGAAIAAQLKLLGCPADFGWELWSEYLKFIFPSIPTTRLAVRYAHDVVHGRNRAARREMMRETVAVLRVFAECQVDTRDIFGRSSMSDPAQAYSLINASAMFSGTANCT